MRDIETELYPESPMLGTRSIQSGGQSHCTRSIDTTLTEQSGSPWKPRF